MTHKLVAPHMDLLLGRLDRAFRAACEPSDALGRELDRLFAALAALAPLLANRDARAIWIRVP